MVACKFATVVNGGLMTWGLSASEGT